MLQRLSNCMIGCDSVKMQSRGKWRYCGLMRGVRGVAAELRSRCRVRRLHVHRLQELQERFVLPPHGFRCGNSKEQWRAALKLAPWAATTAPGLTQDSGCTRALSPRTLTVRHPGGGRRVGRVLGRRYRLLSGDFSVDPVFQVKISENTRNTGSHDREVALYN